METISLESFSRVCRTCKQIETELKFLNICDAVPNHAELQIWELLMSTAPQLDIRLGDELPQQVCMVCLTDALKVQEFQQMCLQSQQELHHVLSESTIETKFDISLIPESLTLTFESLKSDDPLQQKALEVPEIKQEVSDEPFEYMEVVSDETAKLIIKEEEEEVVAQTYEVIPAVKKRKTITAPKTRHVCHICGKSFPTPGTLQRHLSVHNPHGKPFECVYCKYRFPLADELLQHHFTDHNNYLCVKCLEGYENREALLEHITNCPGFHCDHCNGKCENTGLLTRHMLVRLNKKAGEKGNVSMNESINNANKYLLDVNSTQAMDKDSNATTENSMDESEENPDIFPSKRKKEILHNCKICSKTFNRSSHLTRHAKLHMVEGQPLECLTCKCRYATKGALMRHEKIAHSFHECVHCPRNFEKKLEFVSHIQTHAAESKDSSHTCNICLETFEDFVEFTYHLIFHRIKMRQMEIDKRADVISGKENQNDSQELPFQQRTVTEVNQLAQIENSISMEIIVNDAEMLSDDENTNNANEQQAPSAANSAQTTAVEKLAYRNIAHMPNEAYKCLQCAKGFINETLLNAHVQNCDINAALNESNGENSMTGFVCVICNETLATSQLLITHIRGHHKEQYLCEACGKSFNAKSYLKQHVLARHTPGRSFECCICSRIFQSYSGVHKHMIVHSDNTKPYVCSVCGKSFSRHYTLTIHKRTHSNLRPHACTECNKSFYRNDQLRTHMRIHTGEKPYKCKYCERCFRQSGDFLRHVRRHLGDKIYKCQHCPEKFRFKSERTKHYETQCGVVEAAEDGIKNEVTQA